MNTSSRIHDHLYRNDGWIVRRLRTVKTSVAILSHSEKARGRVLESSTYPPLSLGVIHGLVLTGHESLAHTELYLAIATIFRRFEFELYDTDISDIELDFFLPSSKLDSKGVRVKVTSLSS
jgi:hypothetical protein